jgi:tight adherence protein C
MTIFAFDVFRALAFAAFFSGLFVITRALIVGAPPSPRLGFRGMRRQRKIAEKGSWTLIEPAVRWLGARINPLVDDAMRAKLDDKLTLAGDPLGLVPEELVALCVLGGAAGLAASMAADAMANVGMPLILGSTAIGIWMPLSSLKEATATRFKLIARGLPGAVDLLALCMGAGQDFPGAVRQVVEKYGATSDPLVEELTLLLQGLQLGQTRVQVLRRFAERVPTEVVKDFTGAVIQAEQRGSPVVPVLRIQADVCRQRRSVRAEEQAAKAGTAMALPLVFIFVAVLLLIAGPMILKLKDNS